MITAVNPTSSADMSMITSNVVIMAMPRSFKSRISGLPYPSLLGDISIDAGEAPDIDRRRDVIANVVVQWLGHDLGADAHVHVDLPDLVRVVGQADRGSDQTTDQLN